VARPLLKQRADAVKRSDPIATAPALDVTVDRAVLSYLADHPDAMDTLEGIAEWWIERERIRLDVLAVSRALGRLMDRGVIEKVGAGERALYRLTRGPTDGGRSHEPI
jgi:hypothetical protein